jgi:hypothetical protein
MIPEHNTVPAAATAASDTTQTRKSSRGILCAKCEHVNAAGSTKCNRCGSHLHVKCNDCGVINERILSTCKSCGRRLHKNVFQKIGARLGASSARVQPLHVLLFVVVVGAITYGIILLTQLQLPKPH